jgi:hypothetical protein
MPVSLKMSNQNMIMNHSDVLKIYLFLMGIVAKSNDIENFDGGAN